MAGLCLPQSIKEKLRGAFVAGDINMDTLYGLKGDDLNTVFSHYVGSDSASTVSAVFEKAKLDATKAAAADYVSASDKASFKQGATGAKFAQKILSDTATKKLAVDKIDQAITNAKARLKAVTDASVKLTGEDKANATLKASKLQDQIDRLNVRREDTVNPSTDRMLNKIQGMKTLLGDEDYTNLVKAKMGQDVSPAQGKYIVEQASKLRDLSAGNKDATFGMTPEYLQAKGNLDSYINNLNPDPTGLSIIKNLIEIGKNNLITSIATPLKTGISSLTTNPMGMIIRRISTFITDQKLTGVDSDFTKQLKQENWSLFKKTGSNAAAMNSIDDASTVLGAHNEDLKVGKNFTTNETYKEPTIGAKVKGVVGGIEKGVAKAAQISHSVAINFEHNYLFTKVYGSAFADAINFRALDIAKTEGLTGDAAKTRGAEIMRDAAKVEPATEAGKALRAAGQEAAMKVLNVNDTYASRVAVGMKNALNAASPNIPIGTLLEPFGKIPANVIENGIKTTPLGIPDAGYDIAKGLYDMRASNTLETRYQGAMQYKTGIEKLIGITGSVSLAYLMTQGLTTKDFRSDAYGDHFVLIGGLWINTEYFSRLAPNISGLMALKANPKENPLLAFTVGSKIGQGATGGLLNVPGVDNINQALQAGLSDKVVGTTINNAESYAMPAGLSNMFKSRPINRLFFGASGVETPADYKADTVATAKKAAATRAADAKAKAAQR